MNIFAAHTIASKAARSAPTPGRPSPHAGSEVRNRSRWYRRWLRRRWLAGYSRSSGESGNGRRESDDTRRSSAWEMAFTAKSMPKGSAEELRLCFRVQTRFLQTSLPQNFHRDKIQGSLCAITLGWESIISKPRALGQLRGETCDVEGSRVR